MQNVSHMLTELADSRNYVKTDFKVEDLPDLKGKNIIVTGGNGGIGYETCLVLVQKNARVFMASRSEERATEAIKKIKEKYPDGKIEFIKLDLKDMNQTAEAAQEFLKKKVPLDILINNAGIMACPFELTKDGLESQFATNHMGHFVFTMKLLPHLLKSKNPRIVNLSSHAHRMGPPTGLALDKMNDPKAMDATERYGQSKLANVLFSNELHRRYHSKGLLVNSVHPGVVNTELISGIEKLFYLDSYLFFLKPLGRFLSYMMSLTPQQGAITTLYVAASPEIVEKKISGKYFIPFAKEAETLPLAQDETLAKTLWDFSEKAMNEKLK